MCGLSQAAAPATIISTSWLARNSKGVELILDFEAKRLRKPTDSDFRRMLGRRRKYALKLVDDLLEGKIGLDEFERYFDDGLKRSHINAAVMGRQRAGDLRDEDENDEIFGLVRASQDLPYLSRFIRDLRGRYDIPADELKIKRRALMYVNKSRATASEAFVWASPVDALFSWVMMSGEDHCNTCPIKAANGPYDVRTLGAIGYPAQGSDACKTNCRCRILRNDGIPAFGPVPMATLSPSKVPVTV